MPVNRERLARDRMANACQRERDNLATYTNYMRRLFMAIPDISEGEKLDRLSEAYNLC